MTNAQPLTIDVTLPLIIDTIVSAPQYADVCRAYSDRMDAEVGLVFGQRTDADLSEARSAYRATLTALWALFIEEGFTKEDLACKPETFLEKTILGYLEDARQVAAE
jgi:hypothetical protein